MALKAVISESKEIALWRDYKSADGETLARFKIRGIEYKPYRVSLERAQNQVVSKGYDLATVGTDDKLWHELVMEAAGCHLIADWEGVEFEEEGAISEVPYTPQNAIKLLNLGDVGIQIWLFVKKEAETIQSDADKLKSDTLGKSPNSTDTPASTPVKPSTKKGKGKPSA